MMSLADPSPCAKAVAQGFPLSESLRPFSREEPQSLKSKLCAPQLFGIITLCHRGDRGLRTRNLRCLFALPPEGEHPRILSRFYCLAGGLHHEFGIVFFVPLLGLCALQEL